MDSPDYRHDIGDGLVLRWSTAADRAGIALVGALAFGQDEGHEADGIIRTTERCAMDEFWNGSSSVCPSAHLAEVAALTGLSVSTLHPSPRPFLSSTQLHRASAPISSMSKRFAPAIALPRSLSVRQSEHCSF